MLTAIAHRAALFLLHRADLHALVDANAGWYSFQNLPRELLRDHLGTSLLILQQFPPLSNLLMGLALKGSAWPTGVAEVMIGLQTLFSILTAGVLVHVLSVLCPRRPVLWILVGLVFVLNTDLVVLEYNSFGQTIYEPITMFLTLVMLDVLVNLRRTGRLRYAGLTGVVMGLLVLARASWYLFPVTCLALVALLAPARRVRAVVACLVPILVLQGGWAIKNYLVWGYFSPTTSSLGGLHATVGLRSAGFDDDLRSFERDYVTVERGYPPWQVAIAQGGGVTFPAEIQARDEAVARATGLTNPALNTLAVRCLCVIGQGWFLAFVRAHPDVMLRKLAVAYQVFWQPIANYGQQFVALFVVGNHITSPFDFTGIVRQLIAGTLPETAAVMSGSHHLSPGGLVPRTFTPARIFTARSLEPFVLMLNIVSIHLLLPLVGALWLAHRLRHGAQAAPLFDPLRMTALLVGAVCYAYLAILVNLVETSENMRYRLEVEPIIWVITVICLTELVHLARRGGGLDPDRPIE